MTENEQATPDNNFSPETLSSEPVAEPHYEVGDIEIGRSEPTSVTKTPRRRSRTFFFVFSLLIVFILGLGSGILLNSFIASQGSSPPVAEADVIQSAEDNDSTPTAELEHQMPMAFTLPVSYGTLGPDLIEAGAIDRDQFVNIYQQAGRPLNEAQLAILDMASDRPITLDAENAYFLLNFFWALGLVNQNQILTEGEMMQYGGEAQIGRFVSTGGWTVGSKTPTDLYASTLLVQLTPEQQVRLEEVAQTVYRPCCNNHTAFPDCNHGMAMLALLELMAAADASPESMFEAAKWANAFWFPQQSQELATFFKATQNLAFDAIDGQQAVSVTYFSGSGFQGVHQWLSTNGLLEQAPSSGGSCGV